MVKSETYLIHQNLLTLRERVLLKSISHEALSRNNLRRTVVTTRIIPAKTTKWVKILGVREGLHKVSSCGKVVATFAGYD